MGSAICLSLFQSLQRSNLRTSQRQAFVRKCKAQVFYHKAIRFDYPRNSIASLQYSLDNHNHNCKISKLYTNYSFNVIEIPKSPTHKTCSYHPIGSKVGGTYLSVTSFIGHSNLTKTMFY